MMTGKPMPSHVLQRVVEVLNRAWSSRNGRHTGFLGQALGGRLVSHLADLIAGRADEGDVGGLAGIGELGVLGEKAVARDGSRRLR